MSMLDCSLLSDGPSDVALVPMIEWALAQHALPVPARLVWADLRRSPNRARTLKDRIRQTAELYPCDILFVHRDAEGQNPQLRYDEIAAALTELAADGLNLPHVCVVPVRMQEAWLLIDEQAIRRASGNPHGRTPLNLPRKNRIEALPDPKIELYNLLRKASGRRGRRLKKFRPEECAILVSEHIGDFSVLNGLPAFDRMVADIGAVLRVLPASN